MCFNQLYGHLMNGIPQGYILGPGIWVLKE